MLLIIEDNVELVGLYRAAMGLIGIVPEVETTGPAAMRRIQRGNGGPDAVLLDLHLKKEGNVEVNGEELFGMIRAAWPATRIAVVSADLAWCNRFVGVADAVIEKPISDMGSFLDTVRGLLEAGRQAKAGAV